MSHFPLLDEGAHVQLEADLHRLLQGLRSEEAGDATVSSCLDVIRGLEDRLIRPGWQDAWRDSRVVFTAWFGDIRRDQVARALHEACVALVRFVLADVPDDREEFAGQLASALRRYLCRRGHALPNSTREGPRSRVIVSLGECMYRIGDHCAVTVSDLEDNVLQLFLKMPAVSLETLTGDSGVPSARRILLGLRKKYGGLLAPAITLPGGKGRGGYRVSVQVAEGAAGPGDHR